MKLAVNAISLLSPFTGIGQYTKQLMIEIEKRPEIEPRYFYGLRWGKSLRDQPYPGMGRFKKLVRSTIPYPYEISRFFMNIGFGAGARTWGADLYHEPNFLPFQFRGPVVTTIHDLSYLRFPETHPKLRVATMRKLLPKAIDKSAYILTDSEFIKQEIVSLFGASPDKVHAVHLGVSSHYHPMTPQETHACMKQYHLTHGRYVLAVGTLEPRKNLPQALKAYQNLPNRLRSTYPLVIAGMKGWFADAIESTIRNLEEKGQVRLLGYVADGVLPQLYAGAAMLLYPSLYEGFGLPPLEAMASGIPVITSNQSSMPEVVDDAGYTIDPSDTEAMTVAMQELIEAGGQRQMRIERGLARARLFTWQRCAEQTVAVYKSALSGP